jgi:hypothetical protein
MQYGGKIVNANHEPLRKRGWRDSTARRMEGKYGVSGKHMEDAQPVRPGKLVDRAEPVRMACQYTSSTKQLLYPANLESPFIK